MYPYLAQISLSLLNKGVNDFAFFVGTRVEEETNKLSLILRLVLENGMVTSAILLHQSLSWPNLAVPLNKGVNDLAFFVGTRVDEETNQLSLIL